MSVLPAYPDFSDLSLEMARELAPHLVKLPDGISEYSFAGFYLFRHRYGYRVCVRDSLLVISGERDGKKFFITPCCKTGLDTVRDLFQDHDWWKLVSPDFIANNGDKLAEAGYEFVEDRDNWDYLYSREELATLSGKKFHKKKNHVNAFEASYPDHRMKPLDSSTAPDALSVLEAWVKHEDRPENTDYAAAKEALELLDHFAMSGLVLYVGDEPVAWTLAETLADGLIAAIHFEKARTEFRGAYQFINYAFARALPPTVRFINREQDLGDEGMRQAKLTYRPTGFVKKYKVLKK